ncbi:hypothetical protein JTE90_009094 [Oedothorax gibbosus]|uniref:Uncharacterized protein n=1 Tax=Oedothorax gibbosus TaxID=931172 RepID=A0AAV6UZW5_9ARAC|nr:hypothetical protein JTE90_009094 [Oedothorax gibbosus]
MYPFIVKPHKYADNEFISLSPNNHKEAGRHNDQNVGEPLFGRWSAKIHKSVLTRLKPKRGFDLNLVPTECRLPSKI